MFNYQDKNVVIVGLGATGLSCVDYFLQKGVIPKVIDSRSHPPGLDKLSGDIELHLGSLSSEWLLSADLIVVSPGIALSTPELQQASHSGIEIIGDIELFCREAQKPIIAITGSNGKSTVTTLVGEMAKSAGLDVGIGGNIGVPALQLLRHDFQLYVLELSSFQLETTYSLNAASATILNVTEDHMDRYPEGLSQYHNAKLKIYDNAKFCVINIDDALTFPKYVPKTGFISFGLDYGDYSLITRSLTTPLETWLAYKKEAFLDCAELKMVGQHNYINALAALALAEAVGIPRKACIDALVNFAGLKHRCQLVWQNNNVDWINDSKATNVGSTEAALKGIQCHGTLHLLLGGDGKGADFASLKNAIQGDNIRLYCFGRDARKLQTLRPEIAERTETMAEAMVIIAPRVEAGDVVLLSPACASLDQFRNYEQRGDEFARLARELG